MNASRHTCPSRSVSSQVFAGVCGTRRLVICFPERPGGLGYPVPRASRVGPKHIRLRCVRNFKDQRSPRYGKPPGTLN